MVGPGRVQDHDAFLRVPCRRGLGLHDARAGRDRLPGVDHLDRDRPARAHRAGARRVPRGPQRLRVGRDLRVGRRGDPDHDAHVVSHQGTPGPGGGEVPRDRGRRADPAQTGGLRRRTHHNGASGGLMAGKVFFSVTMSLDGFMAPEAVPVEDVFSPEGRNDPSVQRWMAKWSELQAWLFPQRWFRENLKLGEGGEEGLDNDIARATYERTGVSIMGKRMFDAGELAWPEEAPFHTPVFVLTHTKRETWERPAVPPSSSS